MVCRHSTGVLLMEMNSARSAISIGYTLRSRELCDLFTECRRHEVNKKHSPETEVYNMLLLWAIFTKQRFAALETHSN